MTNESSPDDRLKDVWQNQKPEGIRMSIEDLRRKAGKFNRRIWWRNAREYAAVAVVVVMCGIQWAQNTDTLTRVGMGLIIAGMLFIGWHLRQKGSSRSLPEVTGFSTGVDFFKRELVRQRDLLQSVARWAFRPLIPGWIVLEVAIARTNPGHLRHFALHFTGYNVVAAVIFITVWKLNLWAARKLQRRIDELDAL